MTIAQGFAMLAACSGAATTARSVAETRTGGFSMGKRSTFASKQASFRCAYCGLPAQSIDHVVPRSMRTAIEQLEFPLLLHGLWRVKDLVVPACLECNVLLGDSIQPTLKERRAAAHQAIRRKYSKYLSMPDWSEAELDEMGDLLRPGILHALYMRSVTEERLRWTGNKRDKQQPDSEVV